jgi:hypothetical protein
MSFERTVQRGLGAPHALRITVVNRENAAEPLDLTTATAVEIEAKNRSARTTATWSAAIVSQSATELVLVHVYGVGEITDPKTLELTVRITAGGVLRYAGREVAEIEAGQQSVRPLTLYVV